MSGIFKVAKCSVCKIDGIIVTQEGLDKLDRGEEFKHVNKDICVHGLSLLKPRGKNKERIINEKKQNIEGNR